MRPVTGWRIALQALSIMSVGVILGGLAYSGLKLIFGFWKEAY